MSRRPPGHGPLMALSSAVLLLVTSGTTACFAGPPASQSEADKVPAKALAAVDLEGNRVDPFKAGTARGIVLLFISNDCPISNRYAPEIRRLHAKYDPKGIRFWLVHPNPDESPGAIAQHAKEYRLECAELRDPHHALVARAKAQVTPEAAVFSPSGKLVYHGRIDNQYVDVGQERPFATQHDLEEALEAVLAGKTVKNRQTAAIGCYIPELR